MSVQESTAGNKPVDNLASSKQPVFDWLKDHLLPSVVLIFSIVIFFLFGTFSQQPKTKQVIDALVTEGIAFEEVYDEARFKEFLEDGIKAGSSGYENLMKAFVYLSSEYTKSPTSEKRETLLKLSQYISKNFPKEAEAANLEVPCREGSCGAKFVYSNELSDIKTRVEDENKLSQIEKKVILINLEDAAIAASKGDKTSEFNNLSTAFQSLRDIWRVNKDTNIEKLAEDLLTLMREIDEVQYQFGIQRGYLILN